MTVSVCQSEDNYKKTRIINTGLKDFSYKARREALLVAVLVIFEVSAFYRLPAY